MTTRNPERKKWRNSFLVDEINSQYAVRWDELKLPFTQCFIYFREHINRGEEEPQMRFTLLPMQIIKTITQATVCKLVIYGLHKHLLLRLRLLRSVIVNSLQSAVNAQKCSSEEIKFQLSTCDEMLHVLSLSPPPRQISLSPSGKVVLFIQIPVLGIAYQNSTEFRLKIKWMGGCWISLQKHQFPVYLLLLLYIFLYFLG